MVIDVGVIVRVFYYSFYFCYLVCIWVIFEWLDTFDLRMEQEKDDDSAEGPYNSQHSRW